MTQLDDPAPWQRNGHDSLAITGTTPDFDQYGLSVYSSPSVGEIVDPYLGALHSYQPPDDRQPHFLLSELTPTRYISDAMRAPASDIHTESPVVAASSVLDDTYLLAGSEFGSWPPDTQVYQPTDSFGVSADSVAAPHSAVAPEWPSDAVSTSAEVLQSGAAAPTLDDVPPAGLQPPSAGWPYGDQPRDIGGSVSPRPLRARSIDDRMSWWGSALGGLALASLVYERLLPFGGVVGFYLVYQLLRLALLVAVTALSHPKPVVFDRLATATIRLGAQLVFGALAWTIGFVFLRGWRTLHHVAFYTHTMAGVLPQSPVVHGGVLHALVGSGIELTIATFITLPLGIMTAVYMTEVGGRLALIVRTVIEAMTSLPDLLAGLFIYTVLIIGLGFDRSGLAAALALSITMLPLVARSAEVALRVVPGGLRDAGAALGSTQWRTVLQVVLPTAAPGLATALIIAVARAVGETAPVLITSGASTFLNVNPIHNPMNSLPLFIYASLRSGEPNNIARGFGAAVLLLVVVLIFFVLIRLVASRSVKTR